MAKKAKLKVVEAPIKLRLGIGEEPGFTKVKSLAGYDAGTVEAIFSSFHYHRLSLVDRMAFTNEAWRLLRPDGQLMIVVPHHQSDRAYSDPYAHWPPVTPASFQWFNREWRKAERVEDLGLECHFSFGYGYGFNQYGYLAGRNEEFVQHAAAHEWNAADDLHATLTKLV